MFKAEGQLREKALRQEYGWYVRGRPRRPVRAKRDNKNRNIKQGVRVDSVGLYKPLQCLGLLL